MWIGIHDTVTRGEFKTKVSMYSIMTGVIQNTMEL